MASNSSSTFFLALLCVEPFRDTCIRTEYLFFHTLQAVRVPVHVSPPQEYHNVLIIAHLISINSKMEYESLETCQFVEHQGKKTDKSVSETLPTLFAFVRKKHFAFKYFHVQVCTKIHFSFSNVHICTCQPGTLMSTLYNRKSLLRGNTRFPLTHLSPTPPTCKATII